MTKEIHDINAKALDFVTELIEYIFEYPDDDYMTMECLCRKLHKHGLIDKKDGHYLAVDDTEEEMNKNSTQETSYEAGCSRGYLRGYRQGRKDAIISEPVFIDIMNEIMEYNNRLNELEECLDGAIVEWMCKIIDATTKALSVAVNDLDDYINWWMWEKDFGNRDDIKVYDEDDNELPSETLSDLYKLVTRQFADEIDYDRL